MSLPFVDPENYETLLDAKKERLNQQFSTFNPPALECFASPKLHYRMRAELRVWHNGDELYYIMFDKKTKQKFRVDQFPRQVS